MNTLKTKHFTMSYTVRSGTVDRVIFIAKGTNFHKKIEVFLPPNVTDKRAYVFELTKRALLKFEEARKEAQ